MDESDGFPREGDYVDALNHLTNNYEVGVVLKKNSEVVVLIEFENKQQQLTNVSDIYPLPDYSQVGEKRNTEIPKMETMEAPEIENRLEEVGNRTFEREKVELLPLAGWVQKQGEKGIVQSGFTAGYKKRWFSIKHGESSLSYYKKQDEQEAKGKIDLVDIVSVEARAGTTHDFFSLLLSKREYCFVIKTKARTYKCLCDTEEERNRWVQGLNEYLRYQK